MTYSYHDMSVIQDYYLYNYDNRINHDIHDVTNAS